MAIIYWAWHQAKEGCFRQYAGTVLPMIEILLS
jgi:hypothetical protein